MRAVLRSSAPVIAAAVVCATGAVASAAVTITPIALSGTDGPLGPGMGPGVMFTDVDGLCINDAGHAGIRGAINTTPAVTYGLWTFNGTSNSSFAMGGALNPAGNAYPNTGFSFMWLNDAEHRAWRNPDNTALFADVGGGGGVIMTSGGAAPGTGGANFSSFGTSPLQLLTGDGRMVFRAGLTANAGSTPPTITTPAATANANGIWGGPPGSVALLARQNDEVPSLTALDVRLGSPASGFSTSIMSMNGNGTLLFTSSLQGTVITSGSTSNNQALIRKTDGGPLTVIARRGDPFPTAAAGENYQSIEFATGNGGLNNAGKIAYTSSLRGGAITGTVMGLFSDTTGTLTLHARTGTPIPNIAPASGRSFDGLNWGSSFTNVSVIRSGTVVFYNSGIPTNDEGIFTMSSTGVFSALWHKGDPAPGAVSYQAGDTITIGTIQGGLSANALGQVVFSAGLTGTIPGGICGCAESPLNNSALWAINVDGSLNLLAQKGSPFQVAPGDIRTIASSNLYQASTSGNEDGRQSNLSDRGDVTFSLDFTDGSTGVFVANIPAGACCQGSTCSITTPEGCTGPNTAYAGNGTLCNAPGNNTTPCCKADYNHSGSVSVQDIFDFLAGYFSGNPNADINASGAVSVQDIFDYLATYFSGC